ncbi:MAG: serine/threonine protein kinase [Candidatus Schekmanbacteria bacterium]|nr:serine/threonine protein kinase [Candidatus Schekmanbacteria bacterium]
METPRLAGPPPPPSCADQPLANRYSLRHELGSGASGTVFLARDRVARRDVALKLIPDQVLGTDGDQPRGRALREARVLARLHHPGIPRLYEIGEFPGGLFIAMELIEGTRLDALIGERTPLPEAMAVHLARQALAALGHVHAAGALHRDLKPENFILGREDRVYLIDFGFATHAGAMPLTMEGQTLGTVAYMAPEQLRCEVSPASDLYSVGMILHELLTGALPWRGCRTENELALAIMLRFGDALPAPSRAVSPGLWEVVKKACAAEPEERYATAESFGEALRAVAEKS